MKTRHLLSLMLAVMSLTASAQPGFGTSACLRDGWRFVLADDSAAIAPSYDDSRWQRVVVPHDWGVTQPMSPDRGSCQGYLPGGIGWYRLHLTPEQLTAVPEDSPSGHRFYIYFEGVYNRSTVYLNGHRLGYRPSGFASFLYDLTPHLRPGEDNVLAVRVDHSRQDDARWYTGSGIYRPVWLVTAPATHFALWGTSWKLKSINQKKAVVEVSLTPDPSPKERGVYTFVVDILDATGNVVATSKSKPLSPSTLNSQSPSALNSQSPSTLNSQLSTFNSQLSARPAGTLDPSRTFNSQLSTFNFQLTIPSPHRWTLADPYLYKVRARLMQSGREIDRSEMPLGLRTLEFSPDKGFALNGEWMKVKGVCVHDDAGVLGTAVPADVWKRRLLNLKAIGVNALRMSHNPHAPALYDLCDSLGLLVMDEASDEWEFPKRKWLKGWNQGTPGYEGTYDYFEEWIDRDVADMVRRDRCHPSIFLWSIGNEVDYPNDPYTHPILDGGTGGFTQPMYGGYKPGQPNAERIGRIAQRLAKVVRDIDDSRAVTGALAGVVMSNETAYPEAVDVVGYNYTESRYAEDHQRYPHRVIYGSENRHDLPAWRAVTDNEHIFGQFLWTGIDYLGESGPWPARGSTAGLLDLAGNIKPIGHYRAALWSTEPVCYIGTYPNGGQRGGRRGQQNRQWVSPYAPAVWNYEAGQPVRVVCYTNAATARLLLNGQPVGGEPTRDKDTDILYWDITYQPGTLRCEALTVPEGSPEGVTVPEGSPEGTVLATASIVTAGRPLTLRATADKTTLHRPDEVAQIMVEVIDEQGNLVPLADNNITCMAQPPARLLGLENADIRDTSPLTDREQRAHGGRLMAYIGRGNRTGTAKVMFTSPLLGSAEVELNMP